MIILLGILTTPLVVLLAFLTTEVVAAVIGRRPEVRRLRYIRPRVAVLIPAHDEEEGIAIPLAGVVHQLRPGDRCVVVADNCRDRTAAVAADFGVEVLERRDDARRGKGYALDHGLRYLRADPPDVVVVIDADCIVAAGALGRLAEEAAWTGQPVQGCNLLEAAPGAALRARLSAFAFRFKNQIRAAGMRNLGGPCLLFGTGMAFPWRVLAATPLATGNSVEDMRLSVDLALAGHAAHYIAAPCVSGSLPTTPAEAAAQRRRWEHGHLVTLFAHAPRILAAGMARRRLDLCLLALDLAVPPLSLLALLCGAVTAMNLAAWLLIGIWGPLVTLLAAEGLAAAALTAAWLRFARGSVSLLDLARLPFYALAKAPLYLAAVFRPQRLWAQPAVASPSARPAPL